jgi:hypothetical protein
MKLLPDFFPAQMQQPYFKWWLRGGNAKIAGMIIEEMVSCC